MPDEISAEERERRRLLAERLGTAPGAPGFHEGSAHNPSTPGYGRGPVRWK